MYGKRNAFKLLSVLLIFGLLFAAIPAGQVKAASEIVYNSLPAPLPGNMASVGFQATSTSEFGDYIHLANSNRLLQNITVTMSDWAKHIDYPTLPDAGWNHPITVNIYNVVKGSPNSVGTRIATKTQTFNIPWRPADDPSCSDSAWKAADGVCYHGIAFNITFDLSNLHVILPDDVIVSVAYNTNTHGYAPINASGPYESLNVGVVGSINVGSDDSIDKVFQNSTWSGAYTDGLVGTFSEDSNWTGYGTLPLQITAAPSIPNDVYVNSAWTAVAPGTDPDGAGPAEAMGFDAFATITAGITAVATGGIINVADGTYNEAVVINKANITLKSENGAAATIIDVPDGSLTTGVKVVGTGLGVITIDGFTVKDFTEGGIIQGMASGAGTTVHVLNNRVIPAGSYLRNGIQVSGNDSVVTGNYVRGAHLTADWSGTGILVVNASNVLVENNTVDGDGFGMDAAIAVANWNTGLTIGGITIRNNTITKTDYALSFTAYTATSVIDGVVFEMNRITDYTTGVDAYNAGTISNVDASPNWWGNISGPIPGSIVLAGVPYAPWCTNEGCTTFSPVDGVITLPDGVSAADIQRAIDNAPAGTTIIIPAGSYNFSGGYHIDTPHLTIFLKNGVTIQNSSPCFVVNADYTTVTTESIGGAKCVPTNGASGIEVSAGRLNVIIQGLEIDGKDQSTANGVNFAGAITDVQVLNNYIHDMDGSGVAFAAQPVGTVDIQGNLIKANTGVGVSSPSSLNATYNSWGSYASPTTTGAVTFAPYTHVDVSMTSSGTPWANRVLPGYTITYTVKGNFQNAMGADFKLLYPSSLLSVSSTSMGSYFTIPATTSVLDTTTAGVISFAGYATTAVSGSDLTLYTVTFTAASTGALGVLNLDEATDAFAMAPAGGPSNNIYANALSDGAVDVITALPTMSATGLDVSFAQGYKQAFSLTINNPVAGVSYANPQIQFTLPSSSTLEYTADGGTTWSPVAGTFTLGSALANDGLDHNLNFRVSFPASGTPSLIATLVDGSPEFSPAAPLVSLTKTVTVNPNVTLLGTFSMQGRVNRAGMPVTISSILYGFLNSTTVDLISNNISFSNVAWATYTITTNQARYLNITSDLGKTIAVTGSKTTINALELKGGNAVYSDNEINVADASKVGTDYGKIGASFDGDVNFSNKVDIFDLAIVGGNYGLTSTTAYGTWVP